MEETINLRDLMQTLKKRMSLIILITLTAVLVSGGVSFFLLTPVYETSTQLLVNQSKSDQSAYNNPGQIQTNLQLINTYKEIITSPVILDKVSKELNMKTSDIQSNMTVSNQNDSQVVKLVVQDTDPAKAAKIANETADVFQKDIPDIMNVDNVTILTKAEVGEKLSPVKPKPLLNVVIALVVGLMIGVGISFLLEFLDNTIKTEQDVEKVLDVPVLGSVARIGDTKAEKKSRSTEERGERIG
ncbi:YveK family protein [Rossellomorea marisflavi]|uniref:YveK family protein n=1 Tax=Rossellomorea marisflavi TaxID=189381 RepID=UPI001EE1DA55|nr:Wzz/FepE/Etk N-terminal domain-containing protein [Rossellomorea marisflavi]UKS64977.1 capsular biosynthesis protein [Rossellomorea marisflavi]